MNVFWIGTALLLLVAGSASWLALRPRYARLEPTVTAITKELQKGWYQVSIIVTNRWSESLTVVSLRRVRPKSARIMAPAMSVSTKQGDFQVWSNPALDKPSKSIPIGTVVGPREV